MPLDRPASYRDPSLPCSSCLYSQSLGPRRHMCLQPVWDRFHKLNETIGDDEWEEYDKLVEEAEQLLEDNPGLGVSPNGHCARFTPLEE